MTDERIEDSIPGASPDYDETRILERPDGFYWRSIRNGREYGPFETLEEAVLDMEASDEPLEPGETLEEAEAEIGIDPFIDPETGEPVEEGRPRLPDR